MSTSRKTLVSTGSAMALAAGFVIVGPSQAALAGPAASTSKPSGSAERHCAFVLDRLKPGQTSSRILRQGCAPSKEALAGGTVRAADTHLMSMYENSNLGGRVKHWFGAFGPCDTAGYGIRNLESTDIPPVLFNINDKISSWSAGHSRCNYVNMWEHAVYQGQHAYWHNWTRVNYVGNRMNDKVSSVHVHYEP